jgi:hypothetical protein
LPIQIEVGDGEFASYAGSTFATCLTLVALPFIVLLVVAGIGRQCYQTILAKLQEFVVANLCFMALGYLGPNFLYSMVLVTAHNGTTTEIGLVVGPSFMVLSLVGLLFVVLLKKFDSWFVVGQPHCDATTTTTEVKNAKDPSIEFRNRDPSSLLLESFGATFSAARSDSIIVRLYYVEELVASIIMQSLSGIRPSNGQCSPVAISMALVAGLHLLYVLVVRPYADPLELFFAALGAILLMAMTAVAAATTLLGGDNAYLLTALGVIMLLQSISFLFQLVVMGVATLVRQHKQRLDRQWALRTDTKDRTYSDGPQLELPLLVEGSVYTSPSDAATTSARALNPLTS